MTGSSIRYREVSEGMRDQFVARGYRSRHVFPHQIYFIPTCGPDALKLAEAMCGIDSPRKLWVIGLHAAEAVAGRLPPDLFLNQDLVWHQEHYGLPGHVAFAMIALDGEDLRVLNCVSDLVQRQSRVPAFSTRIDQLFRGWYHMLLNAVIAFARERAVRHVHVPTADLVIRHTDPRRPVQAALFVRVYDGGAVARYHPVRRGDWWIIDVAANAGRVVAPIPRAAPATPVKTICLSHDIERGLGHLQAAPAFAAAVDRPAARALDCMLAIEAEMGVRGTYNVVARLLPDVREPIEAGRHCLGFHSYDHSIRRFSPLTWLRLSRKGRRLQRAGRQLLCVLRGATPGPLWNRFAALARPRGSYAPDQPLLCRSVDYRIRGYRPPQSRITYEITDFNLVRHNYRWLASGARSLGIRAPRIEHQVVKIPIALDDFPLHTRALTYEAWKRAVLARTEREAFTVISVHDCYASGWLHDYRNLLDQLKQRGTLRTLDEIAWDQILRTCA